MSPKDYFTSFPHGYRDKERMRVAKKCKISLSSLRKYEIRERKPSIVMASRLAAAVNGAVKPCDWNTDLKHLS